MSLGRSRYMLYKKIARGGMAEIYLGKQIGEDGFERICCVKRILPHFAQDAEFIEMFRDEAHICKRLQHGNIVRVEGFEEVEGSYAIIMEYINGGDLRSVLSHCERDASRLTVPMALYVTAESARGLHYAHTRVDEITGKALEIVHRDISPQNILLSYEGEVKVTDFGIADAESKATETKPGIVKGKYSYMSPEQISAKTVDARTDVFALAIVLWEMLAMKRLFQGENEIQTIQLVKTCKVPMNLRELNPLVDAELNNMIYRGLSKEPRERYASAADFERELRHYISKNYADFTIADLGNFLKKLLHKKRKESQEDIKSLLSGEAAVHSQSAISRKASAEVAMSLDEAMATPSLRVKSEYTNIAAGGQAVAFSKQAHSPAYPRKAPQPMASSGAGSDGGRGRGASAPQRGATRYPGHRQQRQRSRPAGRSSTPILAGLLVLLLVGMIGAFTYKKTRSNGPSQLEVSTIPEWVKVKLDDKPLYGGAYIRTPVTLENLSSGEHTLVLSRRDYDDEVLKFKVNAGDKMKSREFVLKLQGEQAPLRFVLATDGGAEKIKVRIDDGLFVDELDARKNELDIPHFLTGRELTLSVIRANGQSSFRCTFTPRAKTWQAPFIVRISPAKQTCTYPPR